MARISNKKSQSPGSVERRGGARRGAHRPQKGGKTEQTLVDLIGQTGPESDFDFEPPRMSDDIGLRIPDFSEHAAPPARPISVRRMTSREFNQDVAKAKRAAQKAAVVITDRGKPAFVLMKHEEYRRLLGKRPGLSVLLNDEATKDLEFEPGRIQDGWLRPANLD